MPDFFPFCQWRLRRLFPFRLFPLLWLALFPLVLERAGAAEATPTPNPPPETVNVRDYGAQGDGLTNDSAAISAAVAALERSERPVRLLFPAGQYYLGTPMTGRMPPRWENQKQGPPVRAHLLLLNQKNLTIQGEPGAELICGDWKSHGILLGECENVAVEHLAISYRPLPFIQGRALEVAPNGAWVDWQADEGSGTPERADFFHGQQAHWFLVFDPKTKSRRNAIYRIRFTKMEPRGEGVFRLYGRKGGFPPATKGSTVLVTSRRTSHALYASLGENVRCDDVRIFSSPGLAFHAMFTSNFQVRNSRVGGKPGSGQLLATCADGFHVKMTKVGPTLENSHFAQLDDDGVNVNSTYIRVVDQFAPRVLLTDIRPDIMPGIHVAFLNPNTMESLGEARVEAVRFVPGNHVPFLKVTLDRDLSIPHTVRGVKDRIQWGPPVRSRRHKGPRPTLICNLDAVNRGTRIVGNTFEDFYYRGVLINAADAVIADNTFTGLLGPGVQTGNDLSWYEGPASHNLTISGNRFDRIANSSIYAAVLDLHHKASQALEIKGLKVTDNVFTDIGAAAPFPRGAGSKGHVIDINNAAGVTVTDNHFTATDGAQTGAPIALSQSQEVTISGNAFSGFSGPGPVQLGNEVSAIKITDPQWNTNSTGQPEP